MPLVEGVPGLALFYTSGRGGSHELLRISS